ncbi:MAG: hypothetical protein R2876_01085 [Eubacteriales bacterium]
MKEYQISFKRSLITNIAIAVIIVFVCIATFSTEVQSFVAGTLNAPVFKGNSNGSNVALAISVCNKDNIDKTLEVLDESGADASIFLCPDIYETNMDLINELLAKGIHTGIYVCAEHSLGNLELKEGDYVLCTPSFKKDNLKNASKAIFLNGTVDANKIYSYEKELTLNENMIIVYNIDDGIYRLKALLNEITDKGYNIVNVRDILNE